MTVIKKIFGNITRIMILGQKTDFGGVGRYAAVGFSIGTKGYIGTGSDGSNKKDFWEYESN